MAVIGYGGGLTDNAPLSSSSSFPFFEMRVSSFFPFCLPLTLAEFEFVHNFESLVFVLSIWCFSRLNWWYPGKRKGESIRTRIRSDCYYQNKGDRGDLQNMFHLSTVYFLFIIASSIPDSSL